MAYESPIELFENYIDNVIKAVQDFKDDAITAEISAQYGVRIDKEELKKALAFDRGQYEKGYADAMQSMSETVREKNRLESLEFHGDTYEKDCYVFSYHEMNGIYTITVGVWDGMFKPANEHVTIKSPLSHDEFVAWCNAYTMNHKEDGSDAE